jgi:hypothetical protein
MNNMELRQRAAEFLWVRCVNELNLLIHFQWPLIYGTMCLAVIGMNSKKVLKRGTSFSLFPSLIIPLFNPQD